MALPNIFSCDNCLDPYLCHCYKYWEKLDINLAIMGIVFLKKCGYGSFSAGFSFLLHSERRIGMQMYSSLGMTGGAEDMKVKARHELPL